MTSKNFAILDCTLRDGGYYTKWDYSEDLLLYYFEAINQLPVDYVEIGYLNPVSGDSYHGAFYYLPVSTLEFCKTHCNKKLVAMIDEKFLSDTILLKILEKASGFIDMIRIAVKPENVAAAEKFSKEIKKAGFEVAINVMYATKWNNDLITKLAKVNAKYCNYLYIVDSYGGMLPKQLEQHLTLMTKLADVPLGFHGHNNLELATANSMTAIEKGVSIIDSTIMGMGRGAGNLRTELLLSILNKTHSLEIDFDVLYSLCSEFEDLKSHYKWGSNLPFMVSAIRSEQQDAVNSKVKKRFFSLNEEKEENLNLSGINVKLLEDKKVLLVGGGESVKTHSKAIKLWLNQNSEAILLFSSSKNVASLERTDNLKLHFLGGNEGKRLEKLLKRSNLKNHKGILAPEFFDTNNYIPENMEVYTLPSNLDDSYGRSITSLIFQLHKKFNFDQLLITGYDGYDQNASQEELELFHENQEIFDKYESEAIFSITPSKYKLKQISVYGLI